MNTVFKYIAVILISYLVGSINPAVIFSKAKGFDIRQKGSGNAGGSNVLVVMGKKLGFITMLLDILKAFIVVKLFTNAFMDLELVFAFSAVSCILGHIFPVFYGFRGGKGLACMAGSILAYSYSIFGIMFLFAMVLLFISKYIAIVAVTTATSFPIVYVLRGGTLIGLFMMIPVVIIVWLKHRSNIERILKKEEDKVSIIWKKK